MQGYIVHKYWQRNIMGNEGEEGIMKRWRNSNNTVHGRGQQTCIQATTNTDQKLEGENQKKISWF